ncbi:MAG: hypothetical protein LAD29_13555 [Rhodoferax sp.]|jgi:hypothetical protein|nr:hypothetical protein [Rhodoferax sp.]
MSDHSNDSAEHRDGLVGTAATATLGGDILLEASSTDVAILERLHQLFQRLDGGDDAPLHKPYALAVSGGPLSYQA